MSDKEYSETEEDIFKYVKEDYAVEDFLKNKATREKLYNDAIRKYENEIEYFVEKFYINEVNHCNYTGATIFDNEHEFSHLNDLFKIIFSNINLKYNLDVIFNDEELMEDFVNEELKNKPENS